MAYARISQPEARGLRHKVERLERILADQRRTFASEWPASVVISRLVVTDVTYAQVMTARKLKHAVVAVPEEPNKLVLFAAELPDL